MPRTKKKSDKVRNKIKAEQMRKTRQDKDYKTDEQEKEKVRKRVLRQDQPSTSTDKDKDHERGKKRKYRQDCEYKDIEREKDKQAKKKLRLDENYREKERERNKEITKKLREDESYRVKERDKDREIKMKLREDESYREKEKEKNKESTKKLREDESYREKEKEKNVEAKRVSRVSTSYREIERDRDRTSKAKRRSDEIASAREKLTNKRQKSLMRANEILRYKDNMRQALRRTNTQEAKTTLKYMDDIKLGPNKICCCCEGLFFPHSVCTANLIELRRKIPSEILEQFLNFPMSSNACKTCYRSVFLGKVPKLATSRGLKFPEIPDCLKVLSPLEERMVSPYINFMQIRPLQPYALNPQLSLKGSVVNIPVELNEILEVLPRKFDQMATLMLRLRRHITHKTDYMAEVIRPAAVCDALKHLLETPLYKKWDIQMDSDYFNRYESRYEEKVHFIDETPEEIPSAFDIQEVCIQNEYESDEDEVLLVNRNEQRTSEPTGYIIAPGQDRRPVPWHMMPDLEELSFPKIFCGMPVNKTVTYSDRIKSEVRRYDRRCCVPTRLLYVAKKKLEQMCASNINVCLRKTKNTEGLKAQDFRNKEFKESLIHLNDGYQVLKNIRSSPSFWETKKKVLLAMIRQLGNPTIFLTLSAAEKDWPELQMLLQEVVNGKTVSVEAAMNECHSEKTRLIKNDPVTCARYYDYKINKLMTYLTSPHGAFGEHSVEDSYERVEFQMRGSPHEHMFLWLKNAPKLDLHDPTSIDKCITFIDKHITCEYDKDNPYMTVQFHKHTHTCYKGLKNKKKCRFHYPLPVMPTTRILHPIPREAITDDMRQNMTKIRKYMNTLSRTTQDMTFNDVLAKLELTEVDYIDAIRSSIGRTTVFLRRASNAVNLNCYNKQILNLFGANMDIQFVCDAYSCASYIINYVSKVDAGMSKLLREVASDISQGNNSLKEKLKCMVNAFLNGNLMSAQEAAYHALSLPLSKCSRASVYINTSPMNERVRMLKTDVMLQNTDSNSTDIFLPDIYDKYTKRSIRLENVCLAEFATLYRLGGIKRTNNDDEHLDTPKRQKTKILRYRRYKYDIDPSNYYREKLLLFLPWRDERAEIESEIINYEQLYEANYQTIKQNQQKYSTVEDEELDKALEDATKNRTLLEEDEIDEFERDALPPDQQVDILDQEGKKKTRKDESRIAVPPKLPEPELLALLRSLNGEQRSIVMHILNCFKTNKLPFKIFLSGSAGVGKSCVIKCIYHVLTHYFGKQAGSDIDSIQVLMCAPSGKAAFLINGVTLHTAFALPITQFGGEMPELSNDVANTIRAKLIRLKLLIIDEVSMVGSRMLHRIDCRLRQVMGRNDTFGGVSILTVGDLNQLPPVMDSPIYLPPKSSELNILMDRNPLWDEFQLYELKTIMRQKNDQQFIVALNEIATGVVSAESKKLLETRIVDESAVPLSVIRLYPDNLRVDAYNTVKLSNHPGEEISSVALDTIIGKVSETSKETILQGIRTKKISELGGLPNEVKLKSGLKYMITTNVDVEDGLVNGACGELKNVVLDSSGKPTTVWLSFESPLVGNKARLLCTNFPTDFNESQVVPIRKVSMVIRTSEARGYQIIRNQFPLVLAEALTIHKSQGQTYNNVCLDFRGKTKHMTKQMLYVALSRVTSLEGLFLLGSIKYPPLPKVTDQTLCELAHLRNAKRMNVPFLIFSGELTIIYHNVRSLTKYLLDIEADEWYKQGQVLIFSETRTRPCDTIQITGYQLVFRKDTYNHSVGVMCFAKQGVKTKVLDTHFDLEEVSGTYKSHTNLLVLNIKDVTIISGYKSPSYSRQKFSIAIEALVKAYSKYKLIVMGDFNCDTLTDPFLNSIMHKYDLKNCLNDSVTTDTMSQLDVCYSNLDQWQTCIYESFFSDHKPICFAH